MISKRLKRTALAGLAVLALAGAACGTNDDDGGTSTGSAGDTSSEESSSPSSSEDEAMTDGDMPEDEGTDTAAAQTPTGPACSAIPTGGEGSSAGMADDPAATAASNNPVLSTLVTAVTEAGLVDTLNGAGPFTIFAPSNDAFAKIPADQLNAVLADKELLTQILTLHVVAGEELDAGMLADTDSVATVNGQEIAISAQDDEVRVNDQATVVCANVETANATVHIIDTVLMPEGM